MKKNSDYANGRASGWWYSGGRTLCIVGTGRWAGLSRYLLSGHLWLVDYGFGKL